MTQNVGATAIDELYQVSQMLNTGEFRKFRFNLEISHKFQIYLFLQD